MAGAVRLLVLAAVAAAALAASGAAMACACCAEKGTWYERTDPLESFEKSELARLRFTPLARDVLSPDGRNGTYRVTGKLSGAVWRIQLSGLPTLTFASPKRATTFVTDLRDGKSFGAGGPALYKELRMTGSSTGPGTHYRLILMGRGNNCLQATDLVHWRLEVSGGRKPLAIYGDFRPPAS